MKFPWTLTKLLFLSNGTSQWVKTGLLHLAMFWNFLQLRRVLQGSVLGPMLFILYTYDMWFGLENILVSYADGATLLARIPSPNWRSDVTESLNRDLSKISTWCNLWGMRLNPNKTQSMIVSRSRTVFPPHPHLVVGSTYLNSCEFFKILGVMFDSKFTFERHIRSISSSVAQKIGLLRKSFRIFGDHDVLLRCFNSFILPCSPVWSSAADSHLKLLDKNLRACKFLIPNLTISLQHRCFISSLCMLYKIFHNPSHSPHSELPNLFHTRRVTRDSLSVNSLFFSPMRFHTSQYSRCFIPATTKFWNELPSMSCKNLRCLFIGCGWTVVCFLSLSFLNIFFSVDF